MFHPNCSAIGHQDPPVNISVFEEKSQGGTYPDSLVKPTLVRTRVPTLHRHTDVRITSDGNDSS